MMTADPDPPTEPGREGPREEPREPPREEPEHGEPAPLEPLSLPVRVTLLVVGWLLVLIGVAGLFLPGLQGILTIALGLAIASLGSERIHRFLRARMHPWPRTQSRMERFRERLHRWLARD